MEFFGSFETFDEYRQTLIEILMDDPVAYVESFAESIIREDTIVEYKNGRYHIYWRKNKRMPTFSEN